MGVTFCSSVWPTATLGRTGWWAAGHAGPSAHGARAHDNSVARGVMVLARGVGAGASRLESAALRRGLDGAGTCVGVNGDVKRGSW
jgi:hypothetical protein